MEPLGENHETAKSEFYKFRDKVATCVSLDDIDKKGLPEKVTSFKWKEELFNYNKNLLTSCLDQSISDLFAGIDLENKLKMLHEVELNQDNKTPAWRPQTGKPDLNSIEGKHLNQKKKLLRSYISQIKEESSLLKSEITSSRDKLKKHINEVEEFNVISEKENSDTEGISSENEDIYSDF